MFGFKTIQAKTLTLVLGVFMISLVFHLFHQYDKIKEEAFETLDNINATINKALVDYTSAYVYTKDLPGLQRTIDAFESIYISSITILDQDGMVIVTSPDTLPKKIIHPRFDALLAQEERSIKERDEYLVLNTFDIIGVPIGYMVLEGNMQTYEHRVLEESQELRWFVLMQVFLSIILSVLIAKSLSRPIHQLIDRIRMTKDTDILEFPEQVQREFKYLASTISSTHNRLRSSNLDLEAEVDRKTQELRELNQSLEEKIAKAVLEIEKKGTMLQQQSRLAQMGEMISMIAHQWRQPLGAIAVTTANMQLRLELEEFDLSDIEDQKECTDYFTDRLGKIERFVHDLSHTIDDFRNFYRPNKRSVLISTEAVIDKALRIIKSSLESDGVEMVYEYGPRTEMRLYDGEMMQVILNILKNAQDNFKERDVKQRRITIRTRGEVIEICDNGGGIPAGTIEHVFDPYFSTKDEKNGTGLGLYMSKTIVEEHHAGKLEVFNRDDGVCFMITLKGRG